MPGFLFLRRMWAIAAKEIVQLRRDKFTGGLIVGVPLMQILIFGYGINFDVRNIHAGIVDFANTSASRALIADLQASQVVQFTLRANTVVELRAAIANGTISAGVYIPPDFERRRLSGDRAVGQLFIDASAPGLEGALSALANAPLPQREGIARNLGVERGTSASANANGSHRTLDLLTEYNPERRTAVQIVPALIGVILHFTMVVFTAIALVRERERGNLELLITTPVRAAELMIGKLLPYVAVGLVQTTLILVTASWLFDVPVNGSVAELYLGSLLFIAATLALGLVVSTFAQTQFQAMQLGFVSMLPSILLSGFMFPFDGMPRPVQWFAQIIPLTHFVTILRGVILRGAALSSMSGPVLKLAALAIVLVAIASLRFRKRLG